MSPAELREQLPRGSARVLKQNRGQSGDGVWLVRPEGDGARLRHALRGSIEVRRTWDEVFALLDPYFADGGKLIDQPYQERLREGMIRCYLVCDRVEGFGFQQINALHPAPDGAPPEEAPQPGPRHYFPPARPDFQPLRRRLEEEWLPRLLERVEMDRTELPVIWDADFLFGPKDADGADTWVLSEINVSSVYPFPDEALAPLAREMRARLEGKKSPLP